MAQPDKAFNPAGSATSVQGRHAAKTGLMPWAAFDHGLRRKGEAPRKQGRSTEIRPQRNQDTGIAGKVRQILDRA